MERRPAGSRRARCHFPQAAETCAVRASKTRRPLVHQLLPREVQNSVGPARQHLADGATTATDSGAVSIRGS